MTRHEIRQWTFLSLFQYEFYKDQPDELREQIVIFLESDADFPGDDSERDLICDRVLDIITVIDSLDERIDKASDSWSVSRMNKVDLTLLRLAVYELSYDRLDTGIAINEAVELAKQYGTDESGRFINGVLGQIARQL